VRAYADDTDDTDDQGNHPLPMTGHQFIENNAYASLNI
jgi:hypothetical protein